MVASMIVWKNEPREARPQSVAGRAVIQWSLVRFQPYLIDFSAFPPLSVYA